MSTSIRRPLAEALRVAMRDASWVDHPGFARRAHVIVNGCMPLCGAHLVLAVETAVPLENYEAILCKRCAIALEKVRAKA